MYFKKRTKKEIEEALFLDFQEIKAKKLKQDKRQNFVSYKNFFAYTLSEHGIKTNQNNFFHNSFSSKQVVVKNLSNLDGLGASRALAYVIRNSSDKFCYNEKGEKLELDEIMSEWKKDFSNKKNAKEVWHLSFGINETKSERNLKILEESVKEVLDKNFFEYKYAYVVHSHQSKPHVHVLINKNNQFTKKKLHLSKNEFADFFTGLRNDFAFALNLRGLEYHNHFKIEKDLQREKKKLEELSLFTKTPYEVFVKDEEEINEKINKIEEKIEVDAKTLKGLYDEKNFYLLKEIERIKKLNKNHKALYGFFRKLKQINLEIRDQQKEIKTKRNQVFILKKDKQALELEKMKYEKIKEGQVLSLKNKQALLFFYKNKFSRHNLSKRQLNIMKELEKDIEYSSNEANIFLQNRLKNDFIVSSLLSKKNNSYELIKSHRELARNINFLKQSQFYGEGFEKIEERLNKNLKIIEGFIDDCFKNLEQELKNNLKLSKVKEYERVSQFLNKNNQEELEKLYALLEAKEPKEKVGVSGVGNKPKEKEKFYKTF